MRTPRDRIARLTAGALPGPIVRNIPGAHESAVKLSVVRKKHASACRAAGNEGHRTDPEDPQQKGTKMPYISEDQTIRVGLAGFGMSGQLFQAPYIKAAQGFDLARIFERSGDKAKGLYPEVPAVRTFEELLTPDIDLIVISTPNPLHVPMAEKAILAGKHVVVEKPAAATSAEVEELARLAKEKDVLFTVYQNRRFDGDFQTVRALIEGGDLGDIRTFESRFDRFVEGRAQKEWKRQGGPGVDLLYDLGIHQIDQVYSLYGTPDDVYADLGHERPESPGVDSYTILMNYPGLKVTLEAGEVEPAAGPRFLVNGTKGGYMKFGSDPQPEQIEGGMSPTDAGFGCEEKERWGTVCSADSPGSEEYCKPHPAATHAGNYLWFYHNLREALLGKRSLEVTPEDAANVMRILEACRKSAEDGRKVRMADVRKDATGQ